MADEIKIETVYNTVEHSLPHRPQESDALWHLYEALRCELAGEYFNAESAICTAARRFNYPGNLYLEATRIKWSGLFENMRAEFRRNGREYWHWITVHRVIARRQPIGAPVRLSVLGETKPEVYWLTGNSTRPMAGNIGIVRPATWQYAEPVFVDLKDIRPAYDQPLR